MKAIQTGCVQVSTSSSRRSQVGIVALKIVPTTTCKVDSCSLTTVRVILVTVLATPTLIIVYLTAHLLTRRVHVSTSRTILSVVLSSCLPTILITQTQLFRRSNLTGSTLWWISEASWPMTQQPTLTVCVSMLWTMWMLTFSKSLQITSKQPMVLTSPKLMRSNTCHTWKRGLPTTHTTTRILKGHNCRLIMPFVMLLPTFWCVIKIHVCSLGTWLLLWIVVWIHEVLTIRTVNVWPTIFSPVPTIRKRKPLSNVSSVIVSTQICLVTISPVMKSRRPSRFTMRISIQLTRLMRLTTCHLSMPSCWPTRTL